MPLGFRRDTSLRDHCLRSKNQAQKRVVFNRPPRKGGGKLSFQKNREGKRGRGMMQKRGHKPRLEKIPGGTLKISSPSRVLPSLPGEKKRTPTPKKNTQGNRDPHTSEDCPGEKNKKPKQTRTKEGGGDLEKGE